MASFKVRRQVKAKGGMAIGSLSITTSGGLTASTLTVGESGTCIAKILAGSVSACVPVISSSATAAGSVSITGLTANSKIFFSGGSALNGSARAGVFICNAHCGTNGASLAFANIGGADTEASTMGFHYIAYVLS